MPIYVNLHKIKMERLDRGLSQEQMAKRLNMTRNMYSKRENGFVEISATDLAKIAQALGIDNEKISIFFTTSIPKRERKR